MRNRVGIENIDELRRRAERALHAGGWETVEGRGELSFAAIKFIFVPINKKAARLDGRLVLVVMLGLRPFIVFL